MPLTPLSNLIDGLAQDCSNSIALAKELLQPCAKPLLICRLALDAANAQGTLNQLTVHTHPDPGK